jgi:hypothetical protein
LEKGTRRTNGKTEKYYNGFYKSRIKLLEETLESLKKKEDVETK